MEYAKPVRLLALLVFSSTLLLADVVEVPFGHAAYIAGQLGEQTRGRLLLRAEIPDEALSADIDAAILSIPGVRLPESIPMVTFDVRRVVTSWDDASATWTSPWRAPGGDFDPGYVGRYTLTSGDTAAIRLDVTRCVHAWQGGQPDYGIVLLRPDGEGGGFRGEGNLLREVLRDVRLEIWHTHIQR